MAKGSATEAILGTLHDKVAGVFMKVLARYEARLDAIDGIDMDAVESDVLEELFNENAMPSPAMLSAVTKFLKDNDIGIDSEEIDELSAQQRRLEERRKNRGNIVDLTMLHAVGED